MEIRFIFGRICSGKDYICEKMNENGDFRVITISNILRKITGLTKRSDLLMTEDLKEQIFEELRKEIDYEDKIIINGIRQIEILEYILENYGDKNIRMFWVNCNFVERKKRFENRKSKKDNISIEEADRRDGEMGLDKVVKKFGDRMIIIDNNI